ncbi:MAG: hypothetical protein ACQESR_03840 [Planctomycetota bacterium]
MRRRLRERRSLCGDGTTVSSYVSTNGQPPHWISLLFLPAALPPKRPGYYQINAEQHQPERAEFGDNVHNGLAAAIAVVKREGHYRQNGRPHPEDHTCQSSVRGPTDSQKDHQADESAGRHFRRHQAVGSQADEQDNQAEHDEELAHSRRAPKARREYC